MREKLEDFALGLGGALLGPVVQAMVQFNTGTLDNWRPWVVGIVAGCVVAAGNYLRQYARSTA